MQNGDYFVIDIIGQNRLALLPPFADHNSRKTTIKMASQVGLKGLSLANHFPTPAMMIGIIMVENNFSNASQEVTQPDQLISNKFGL